MSQRVDFPFFAGQDESFDQKVLPAGPVRSAYNVRLDRGGRMKRRYELIAKNLSDETDTPTLGKFREFIEPDHQQWTDISFTQFAKQYTRNSSREVLRTLEGNLATYTTVRRLYTSVRPAAGAQQFCPRAVYDFNGNLVICCLVGELDSAPYCLMEVLDPVTFEVIHRKQFEIEDWNGNKIPAQGLGLARRNNAAEVYIVFRRAPASPGAMSFARIETDGDFNLTWGGPLATSPTDSNIDVVGQGNNNFIVSVGGTAYRYDFNGALQATYAGLSSGSGPFVTAVDASDEWVVFVTAGLTSVKVTTDIIAQGAATSQVIVENAKGISVGARIGEVEDNGGFAWVSWSVDSQPVRTTMRTYFRTDVFDDQVDNRHVEVGVCHPMEHGENVGFGGRATSGHLACELFYKQTLTQPQLDLRQFDSVGPVHVWSSDENIDAKLWEGKGAAQAKNDERADPWFTTDYLIQQVGSAMPAQRFTSRTEIQDVVFPLQVQNVGSSYDQDTTGLGAQVTCVWAVATTDAKPGDSHRSSESLVPGGSLHMVDGHACHLAGYTGPPNLSTVTVNGSGNLEAGTYWISALFEHSDGNGRSWKSAPSTPRQVVVGADDSVIDVVVGVPMGLGAQARGARLVMYLSPKGDTILYRQFSVGVSPGESRTVQFDAINTDGDVLTGTETLYTLGETVSNDPPPQAQFTARVGDRIWAGGLAESSRIQASKVLKPGVGVEWSNFDNFFVDLPEVVTGIAPMDSFLIAMTRDSLYAVSGNGPDDQAIGAFSTPQRLPGKVGCISIRSVVTHSLGVFFVSRRGIELLGRGFRAPEWVGQAVRDTLEAFPYCAGSTYIAEDDTVRWLFSANPDFTGEQRLVIYDVRGKAWFVNEYDELETNSSWRMARNLGDYETPFEYHMVFGTADAQAIYQDQYENEYQGDPRCLIETGSLRTAGLNGWNYGRRVNITGEFRGDTDVTLEFAFNDEKYLPIDTYTWQLRSTDYEVGAPIELELTLPVQLYSTVRFKLSWTNTGQESFHANGISVFFEPAQEGPRVPERAKG